MKNKLTDLTDHLFAQLERLGDESKDADQIRIEIERSGAIMGVAREIVSVGRLAVDAQRMLQKDGHEYRAPSLLGLDRVAGGE